ncbi:hypothetical protein NLI96_g10914 [Meripilus lineatus]|uniref:Prolyl endopeptidase n=1 Tax=Meripilus lineatus TaxID=2056292 RepID=A0AAD5UUC3_9APHY|nr:hypothetical protein NLI96_g10914 [Physisporinus lineatus]
MTFARTLPHTRRGNDRNQYQSQSNKTVDVEDPYTSLEEGSEERNTWLHNQNERTTGYLSFLSERQLELADTIRTNSDHFLLDAPSLRCDGRWYWFSKPGFQPHGVKSLYRSKNEELPDFSTGNPQDSELFFDANGLSKDGSETLRTYAISPDGQYFAYALSKCESDTLTVFIRSTSDPFRESTTSHDNCQLTDQIQSVDYLPTTINWTSDSKGFFYSKSNEETGLYYHRIRTHQLDDISIMDDEYAAGTRFVPEHWYYITNHGTNFYFATNDQADQYKVVCNDLNDKCKVPRFLDVVPEKQEASLHQFIAVGDNHLALTYKQNAHDKVYLYNIVDNTSDVLDINEKSKVELKGERGQHIIFLHVSGFVNPGTLLQYDLRREEKGKGLRVCMRSRVKGLNPDDFCTAQTWYRSKDQEWIPMWIVRHKDTKLDGTAPVLQWGYGGFSECMDPEYNPAYVTFMQKYDGILAVPNLRGGGEFGKKWHDAGKRENKVKSVDDFIAATQFLIEQKIASPHKVVAIGASNGGLIVAASVNRNPGLYCAAVIDVGVLDLLKFPKYNPECTWRSEYGDPTNPKDFDHLYAISPLHNISQDHAMPATLVLASCCDERVSPIHSYKYIATAQYLHPNNPRPILLRSEKGVGHSRGKSTESTMLEQTDIISFVLLALDAPPTISQTME